MRKCLLLIVMWLAALGPAKAQDLTIATVTRPPFSMPEGDANTGFSMELWDIVAADLERSFKITRVNGFGEMLDLVRTGQVDVAVANISITAEREAEFDFSQPIFESGLQIMVPSGGKSGPSLLSIFLSPSLVAMVGLSLALLFAAGMLMWRFEKKTQKFFDKPAKEAAFPAFWWALNLVVNGGFEERPPTTVAGRIFGVLLVISSLFLVSIFVAKVTATLTVGAIQNNVNSINELYRKQVGTIEGSTASKFIEARDLRYQKYPDLDTLLQDFEAGNLDAVIFDAPILAFYANQSGNRAEMVGSLFRRENYGFALPTGSALVEPINRSLLRIREDGTYEKLFRKWFGSAANL